MDTIEKLKVLAGDSQYDLACACGTNEGDRREMALSCYSAAGRLFHPLEDSSLECLQKRLQILPSALGNKCAALYSSARRSGLLVHGICTQEQGLRLISEFRCHEQCRPYHG